MSDIKKLLEIMAALRDPQSGCPWDVEQTFESVAPFTLEEAYEVVDAIDRGDWQELRGELGDLLFQVVFHSRMAEEAGEFDFSDVVDAICTKLTRRHPHVFGDEDEIARGAVEGSWERIKAEERADRAAAESTSAVDGIALALPALSRASTLGKRAASVGFDWPDVEGVRAKVNEELAELDVACTQGNIAAVQEELGDLLFSVANLARHLNIDPERSLEKANRKFMRRFQGVEAAVSASGKRVESLDLQTLEGLWQAQKKR